MELKHLRYFVAVAEELNFSRAAQRLHMTQPPLSVQVKQLEEEIGVPLLERSTRNVRLTEAGQVFLEESRRLFGQLEQSVRTVRRVGHGEVGTLALGFVPTAASETLPPLLRVFRKGYPEVEITLHEMNPPQLVNGLRDGRIDAAFFYLPSGNVPPFGDATLDSMPVSREPLVVALPADHPLAARRRIEMASLSDEPFILLASHRGSGLRDIIVEHCRLAGFMPRVVQEATLVQTIVGLVASGVGVALVPASLRKLQSTGVTYRPVQGSAPMVEMGVVWRRGDGGAVLASFLRVAKEAAWTNGVSGEGEPRTGHDLTS